MAGSVNKVIIVGNLGRDPEVRTFQNGGQVCNLRIATSETWKDKSSGERKERTEWHSIVIRNEGLVRIAEQYLRKGTKVYIEGQIETRKATDQNGGDRYFTEVVLRPFKGELTILSGGSRDGGDDDREDSRSDTSERGQSAGSFGGGGSRFGGGKPASTERRSFSDDLDDEIPF